MENSERQRMSEAKEAQTRHLALYPLGDDQFSQLVNAGHDVSALSTRYPDAAETLTIVTSKKRKSPKE